MSEDAEYVPVLLDKLCLRKRARQRRNGGLKFRGRHARLSLEDLQEVEVVVEAARETGFDDTVARAEHALGLIYPKIYLHLLDCHSIHILKNRIQPVIGFAEALNVILLQELTALVVIDIFQNSVR